MSNTPVIFNRWKKAGICLYSETKLAKIRPALWKSRNLVISRELLHLGRTQADEKREASNHVIIFSAWLLICINCFHLFLGGRIRIICICGWTNALFNSLQISWEENHQKSIWEAASMDIDPPFANSKLFRGSVCSDHSLAPENGRLAKCLLHMV